MLAGKIARGDRLGDLGASRIGGNVLGADRLLRGFQRAYQGVFDLGDRLAGEALRACLLRVTQLFGRVLRRVERLRLDFAHLRQQAGGGVDLAGKLVQCAGVRRVAVILLLPVHCLLLPRLPEVGRCAIPIGAPVSGSSSGMQHGIELCKQISQHLCCLFGLLPRSACCLGRLSESFASLLIRLARLPFGGLRLGQFRQCRIAGFLAGAQFGFLLLQALQCGGVGADTAGQPAGRLRCSQPRRIEWLLCRLPGAGGFVAPNGQCLQANCKRCELLVLRLKGRTAAGFILHQLSSVRCNASCSSAGS